MWQIHWQKAGSLQDGDHKYHPSLGRAEAGTNYPGAAELWCSGFLPAYKLCHVLPVDSCSSAAWKKAGSDSSGARAGLAQALQWCSSPPHCFWPFPYSLGFWSCDCAHLCSVAVLEPLGLWLSHALIVRRVSRGSISFKGYLCCVFQCELIFALPEPDLHRDFNPLSTHGLLQI